MSKKVSRAKRKDLRSKGQLPPVVRLVEERRATERRAEEEEVSERAHRARDVIAIAEESDAAPAPSVAKRRPRQNRTLLVMGGLIAGAGLIFWATQRSPTKETKVDALPKLEAPAAGDPVKLPPMPAITAAPVTPVTTAAPAIKAAPVVTAAPAITAAPAVTATPAKPHEPPAAGPTPRPDKPKAAPKPAAAPDPYG